MFFASRAVRAKYIQADLVVLMHAVIYKCLYNIQLFVFKTLNMNGPCYKKCFGTS